MKKSLLTIAAAFCYSLAVFAQAPPQKNCGTLQHHEYLKQTRPNYENDLIQYNQMIDQYLADKAAGLNVGKTSSPNVIVTVPVVVHVLYRVAAENISDAQAASQVQVLNDDFARLNTDASKVTQPTFSTVASGAQIRFCLAQRDPSGNSTTGVIHKATTVTTFGTNDAVKSSASGGDDPWDVTKYVNIWVCNMGSSLLGYGEFPTGSLSNTWGLVLHYKYTGSGGTAVAPYNLGRTGTHEFGHCFNLYHIWGDDGTACTGSDQCTDTPNQAGEHYGCFAQGSIQTDGCTASSPGVMWMNYMDYTDDACMYMFTAQQCARMEAIVNNPPWNVLGSSLGCTPVSALDAGITSVLAPVNGSSSCNNSVTPKITLTNAGSITLTTAKILYKMDALTTQTLNWSGSLALGTSTVLTLNNYAGLTVGPHTFSATVAAPNAGTDANATNNTMTSTFSVVTAPAGAALPFTERFDATTFPPTGWLKTSANVADASATWTRLANTTGIPVVPTTTACAKMNNFAGTIDITGQLDNLRTPALSLVGTNSTLRMVFDRSHKMYSTTDIDSLNIYISTDCGGSWTRLYTKGGTQLSTSAGVLTTAYTPTANTQWARDSVSLSAYVGQASVYLKFESRSGWGNNLYLDNINVKYTPSSAPPVASFSTAATRCVGSPITFTDGSTNSPTSWTWTFPGSATPTSTLQNPSVTYTAAGTYTITHTAANSSGTSTAVSSTITVSANPTVAVGNATVCAGNPASITASGAATYSWNTGATTASISVTPTITTTYTVTGTNAAGCTNIKTSTVNVNAAPTVSVSNATICRGASTNITASGAASYSWNTGATTASISVSPTVTTNYTVTGTTTGCTNTKTLSVTVNPTPTVAVANATICNGSAASITASGATTYSWNTGATTASISVSPTSTTNYTVTGTSTGCSNTKTVSVTVNASPTVAVAGGTICNGASANLTASGAASYSWNTGATTASISVTPTATTVYTVTGTTTGCTNTKTVNIVVNPIPNVASSSATICAGSTGTITASGAATYSWNTGATTANLTVSPSSNTTYTVTGTSAAGCVKTTTAMITVGSAPSISVNSSTICAGATATLNASGVTSYTWNTSSNATSISVSPTSTSVYTVSGNLTGCAVSAMQTATVTVNNLPTVTMSSVGGPLCVANAPVNLVGTPGGGNFSGTGVVASTFDPSVSGAGTFTVMYTYMDANNCSAVDSKTVNVSLCTGITELTNTNISVYPNPAKDAINVMMDAALINNTSIELYDAIGKLIITEKVINVQTTIKIDALAKGIYTVRIVSEGKQTSRRIIKE
ncbi:MAG: M43 family zinc metalloprotease [Bacteroidota bacterium]